MRPAVNLWFGLADASAVHNIKIEFWSWAINVHYVNMNVARLQTRLLWSCCDSLRVTSTNKSTFYSSVTTPIYWLQSKDILKQIKGRQEKWQRVWKSFGHLLFSVLKPSSPQWQCLLASFHTYPICVWFFSHSLTLCYAQLAPVLTGWNHGNR